MKEIVRNTAKLDLFLLVPIMYLIGLGLVIQSAIANKTNGVDLDINISSQIAAVVIGATLGWMLYRYRTYRFNWFILAASFGSLLLLVLVLASGVESNGSQRWVTILGFQFQPTELVKFSLVLLLAQMFDTRDVTVNRLRTIGKSLIVTVVPAVLIMIQPDLGSAVVVFVVWITILFASRLKLSRLALLFLLIIGAVVVAVPFMAEYQQERLVSYFNPNEDLSGSSYNVDQAQIAIGSGGLLGNGIDGGSQGQLNFLPSQHTDFVFAIVAEKLGLVGAFSVIAAYSMIVMRISYLAWVTKSQFQRGVLSGFAVLLFFHVFVNIGMNLGLVPVTGLPLPLLSYGGTFTLVVLMSIAICMRISADIRSAK